MGFGYRKSYRLGKSGVRLNLSKSGVGASVGVKGLRTGVGPRGTRMTASIPGTGISYTATGGTGQQRRATSRVAHYPHVQLEPLLDPLNDVFGQLVALHPVTTRSGRRMIVKGVAELAWRLGQKQGRQAAADLPFRQPPIGDHAMLRQIGERARKTADTLPPTVEGVSEGLSELVGFAAQYGFIWGGAVGLSSLKLPVESKGSGVSPLALVVGLVVVVFLMVAVL